MAYKGSTELSSIANPPRSVTPSMMGRRSTNVMTSTAVLGTNLWMHNSTDSSSSFTDANYFTDAFYIGMKEGDLIMGGIDTGSSKSVYLGIIGVVSTLGAAIASTGGQLSSTR